MCLSVCEKARKKGKQLGQQYGVRPFTSSTDETAALQPALLTNTRTHLEHPGTMGATPPASSAIPQISRVCLCFFCNGFGSIQNREIFPVPVPRKWITRVPNHKRSQPFFSLASPMLQLTRTARNWQRLIYRLPPRGAGKKRGTDRQRE